jgi:hypothetical protein
MDQRRERYKQRREAAERDREAQEEADSVLYRWYRPDAVGVEIEPIIGPAPKIKPGWPSGCDQEKPPKKSPGVVLPPQQDFDAFLQRQERRVPPPQTPPPPTQFLSKNSKRILSSTGKRPRGRKTVPDECTFQPDRSPTQNFKVAGPPIDWVEPQIVIKKFRVAGLELEHGAAEVMACTWRPDLGDPEQRERIAVRSARARERRSQENSTAAHPEEEDFGAIGERSRQKRLKRHGAWKKKLHILPFDRSRV